jgi:LacI family transcriptional regulator
MSERYKVSMRDIAKAAGISVSAVSLALKNSSKVSRKRKEEIVRIARAMGYRPDPRITELMEHLRISRPQRTSSSIGIIIPELTREELSSYPPIKEMIDGVKKIASFAGFGLDTLYLSSPGMSMSRARGIFAARGIRGVLVAPFASGVAEIDLDCEDLCVATVGYSIVKPHLHRACPNYLQMMDEILDECTRLGYRRIGLIMTYNEGGTGHKLFASSFLYYQSKIPEDLHIPILPKPMISAENTSEWFDRYRPDVIISAGASYDLLLSIGKRIPQDVAFVSIDVSEAPTDAAGANHRYDLVGMEAFKLLMTSINLNLTGVAETPKTVMVDSHLQQGFTLPDKTGGSNADVATAARPRKANEGRFPNFRGFLD